MCFEFCRSYVFFAQVQWNETMIKITIDVYVSPVFQHIGVRGSKQTYHRVVRTSIWFISYSGELIATKIVSSRLPGPWWSEARLVTLMGPSNQNTIKGVPDRLLKERLWCLGYPTDTLHFYWPTDVHNQLTLSVLRELCAITVSYTHLTLPTKRIV